MCEKYSEKYVKGLRNKAKRVSGLVILNNTLEEKLDKWFKSLYSLHERVNISDGKLHQGYMKLDNSMCGSEESISVKLSAEQLREMVLKEIGDIIF